MLKSTSADLFSSLSMPQKFRKILNFYCRKLGIVITKTAPAVLACSRLDLSWLCKSLWTRLWRIPLFLRLRNVSAMLSAESGGLCLGTATRSGVMPILLRIPLHYIVWDNRNEVYVKKLYIVATVVLNLDIQMWTMSNWELCSTV